MFQPRTVRQPPEFVGPNEYAVYANVNPACDHPRWSQPPNALLVQAVSLMCKALLTLLFNGYVNEVAAASRSQFAGEFLASDSKTDNPLKVCLASCRFLPPCSLGDKSWWTQARPGKGYPTLYRRTALKICSPPAGFHRWRATLNNIIDTHTPPVSYGVSFGLRCI